MAHTIEFQLGDFACEMEFIDGLITLDNLAMSSFKNLFLGMAQLNEVVPLASYIWNVDGPIHNYYFSARDGRTWTQTIDFTTGDDDPPMTFAVTDQWKVSEFSHHRAVRDEFVRLHGTLHLHRLEATFVGPA